MDKNIQGISRMSRYLRRVRNKDQVEEEALKIQILLTKAKEGGVITENE
jgi:hypothetical protein